MSSPKSKAAKLFKLERSSSTGVFKRGSSNTLPVSGSDDNSSRRSSETIVDEDYYLPNKYNELSKNISATVKLKAKNIDSRPGYRTAASAPIPRGSWDAFKSRPDLSSYPQLTRAISPLAHTYSARDYSDDDDDGADKIAATRGGRKVGNYQFLKSLSNFEVLDMIYILWNLTKNTVIRLLQYVRSSRYVSNEQNGKIHFQSYLYGFVSGISMLLFKPLLVRSFNYMASMALHVILCIMVVGILSVSITHRSAGLPGGKFAAGTKSPGQESSVKKFDPREYYGSRQQQLDPIRSSQIPLVNPIHPKRTDSSPVYSKNDESIYKHTNHSDGFVAAAAIARQRLSRMSVPIHGKDVIHDDEDEIDDYHEDYEDDEDEDDFVDDVKSVFSVATAANAGGISSKKNYRSFIEQTKRLQQQT